MSMRVCVCVFVVMFSKFYRCLNKSQFLPPDMPRWCIEKRQDDGTLMACCHHNLCNNETIFDLPDLGI